MFASVTVALDLPGPSRRIRVEPLRLPVPSREPVPAEDPRIAPDRAPGPAEPAPSPAAPEPVAP